MVLVVSRLRGRRSRPIYPSPPPHLSIAKSSTPSTYTEASHNFGTAGSASNSFWHHPVTKRPPSMHARSMHPPLLPVPLCHTAITCRCAKILHHCCQANLFITAAITGTSTTIRRANTTIIATGAIIKNWPAYCQRMLGSAAGLLLPQMPPAAQYLPHYRCSQQLHHYPWCNMSPSMPLM